MSNTLGGGYQSNVTPYLRRQQERAQKRRARMVEQAAQWIARNTDLCGVNEAAQHLGVSYPVIREAEELAGVRLPRRGGSPRA